MRRIGCLMFLLAFCGIASAYVVTFEDLPLDAEYFDGDSFTTGSLGGMDALVSDWGPTVAGSALVQDDGLAGGSGNELWISNVDVNFTFDINPLYGLALQFGEYGGSVHLAINGILKDVSDFSDLNGTVIDGVTILVSGTNASGAIIAIGDITSFGIGGQELAIDNIVASVPEPATIAILGLGGLFLTRRRN